MINYIYVHPLKVRDEINYPFPNLNDGTVGVWELVNSYNFILHFAGHVITYPCLGWSWSMLVKRAPKRYEYHSCIVIIARPKGVPPKAARPKDGLFRLHASWIYLSYAGFDCLAAILCH